MINAFNEIIKCEEDFSQLLDKYPFLRIFEPVIIEFPDNYSSIIKYIAYAFSIESNKITLQGDRRKETTSIFKELKIKEEFYTDIILLQNRELLKSVQQWVKFQDSAQLEYLFTLKESYVQQQSAAVSPLKKSDGISIDYDQKQKCIEHMSELRLMIKDAESELKQNDPKLKEAYKEVYSASNQPAKNTMGIESILKDRK